MHNLLPWDINSARTVGMPRLLYGATIMQLRRLLYIFYIAAWRQFLGGGFYAHLLACSLPVRGDVY